MASKALFCFVYLLVARCAHAWDPFGIFASAKENIEEAGRDLIGNAKAAFEESMQRIFDDDITPLVNKVNAMALEDIEVLKEDVEEVVANATKEIKGLIDHAAQVAQRFADRTIEEIKDKLIDETARKVEEVTDHFFAGLSGFLQQFYQTIEKINCMVQGDIDKVYSDVYKLIGKGCSGLWPERCCQQVGVSGKRLSDMGDTQLYNLEICRRTSTLSEHSTVDQLQQAYIDCQVTAKKFYCIDFGTGTARDFFTKEYNKWGAQYAFWSHPTSRHRKSGASVSAPSNACGTPIECYQQAVQMLNEARQDIEGKADKTDLVAANGRIDGLIREQNNTSSEIKVFNEESCPPGWQEVEATKGYVLVGRPQGGTAGTVIGHALAQGEKSRVGPHGHDVEVTDSGHSHSVNDPGHSHDYYFGGGTYGFGGERDGWRGDPKHDGFAASTDDETTGISVYSSKSNVAVSVEASSSEGNPLAYVLLCQRVAAQRLILV